MRISVIGGGTVSEHQYDLAFRLGRELAAREHELVCGGLTGVMEAACKGAMEAGGRTIGILPGSDPRDANPYVDVPITTGIGSARNFLVVLNGDGAIAIDGAYGTLSEIAHALDLGRPVVGLDTHEVDGVEIVGTPEEAIDSLEIAIQG